MAVIGSRFCCDELRSTAAASKWCSEQASPFGAEAETHPQGRGGQGRHYAVLPSVVQHSCRMRLVIDFWQIFYWKAKTIAKSHTPDWSVLLSWENSHISLRCGIANFLYDVNFFISSEFWSSFYWQEGALIRSAQQILIYFLLSQWDAGDYSLISMKEESPVYEPSLWCGGIGKPKMVQKYFISLTFWQPSSSENKENNCQNIREI